MKRQRQLNILAIALALAVGGVATADLVPTDPRVQAFQVSGANPGSEPADYTPTGGMAYGLDITGVGKLGNNSLPTYCTGTLLSGSRHILTAAHCLTDGTGNIDRGLAGSSDRVTFTNAAGTDFTYAIRHEPGVTGGGLISVHPSYDGDEQHGYDVAVIRLPFPSPEVPPVDASIEPYQIVSSGFGSLDLTHTRVGFGYDGNGATGTGNPTPNTTTLGIKHAVQNNWDLVPSAADGDGLFPVIGWCGMDVCDDLGDYDGQQTQLMFDFDNGTGHPSTGGNNALFQAFVDSGEESGTADTGLANLNDEGMSTPGDSGGPVFVNDAGNFKIAGVTSWGFTYGVGSFSPDVDWSSVTESAITNQSFGEVGLDARLSEASVNAFVLNALQDTAVPEPSSFLFLALIGAVGGSWRRLQQWLAIVGR